MYIFLIYTTETVRHLHSFPTRRSSDLEKHITCRSQFCERPRLRWGTVPPGTRPISDRMKDTMTLRIAVFGENRHEKLDASVQAIYPDGMHTVIAEALRRLLAADGVDAEVRIALLDDIEESLSEEALAETDVLTWWGHMAHGDVPDEVSERVVRRVHEGMGLIPLHSAHYSKPFKALMGTTCNLLWRNDGEEERVWTVNGSHPIARGVPHPIIVPQQEM